MKKQSFQSWKRNFTLDMRKEGESIKCWCFHSKSSELVKEEYPHEDVIEYLDVYVDVIEYRFEEKLRQFKRH